MYCVVSCILTIQKYVEIEQYYTWKFITNFYDLKERFYKKMYIAVWVIVILVILAK